MAIETCIQQVFGTSSSSGGATEQYHPSYWVSFLFLLPHQQHDHHHHQQQQHHRQAFLLAAASSTDNLLVGLSVGLSEKPLPVHVLWGISMCNAAGCWIATTVGGDGGLGRLLHWILTQVDTTTNPQHDGDDYHARIVHYLVAAAAFGYLAYQEQQQQYHIQSSASKNEKDDGHGIIIDDTKGNESKPASLLQLALPMTLNNLAGGVTGGVLGLPSLLNACYALAVSVGFMWTGYWVGRRTSTYNNNTTNHSPPMSHHNMAQISIALYLILSIQSLYEATQVAP